MLLAVLIAATIPAPAAPPPLAPLKTISSVRVTPLCSALRFHVAPAISNILAGDAALDARAPFFGVKPKDELGASFGRVRLEDGFGPIVQNMESAHKQLDALPDDAALAPLKNKLEAVLKQQNDELNALSGYAYTADLRALLAAPAWSETPDAGLPGLRLPSNVAAMQYKRYPHVSLRRFAADEFLAAQRGRRSAERAASQAVLAAVDRCAAPKDR